MSQSLQYLEKDCFIGWRLYSRKITYAPPSEYEGQRLLSLCPRVELSGNRANKSSILIAVFSFPHDNHISTQQSTFEGIQLQRVKPLDIGHTALVHLRWILSSSLTSPTFHKQKPYASLGLIWVVKSVGMNSLLLLRVHLSKLVASPPIAKTLDLTRQWNLRSLSTVTPRSEWDSTKYRLLRLVPLMLYGEGPEWDKGQFIGENLVLRKNS